MPTLTNPRLPKGSTILITGVTGYIGSWVAHEALSFGYKVRGAVRSLDKAAWLQAHFDSVFGSGSYSQVLLPDLLDKVSFDAAIKDVDGVVHIAVNTELTPNPEPYIPRNVDETLTVLRTAHAQKSVKSVVLTSSSAAAVATDVRGVIPKDAYNEEHIKLAWDPSFDHQTKSFFVYAAAKAQAEKAAWKFVQEEKPQFTMNTILPNCNFGPSLVYENQGHPSTGGWAKAAYDGDLSFISNIPTQYFIDVRDTARLHIAALVDSGISNERLWGFAEPFNWNSVLAILRKLWPQKEFIDDLPDSVWTEFEVPTESALKALKDVYGQEGWIGIETSLKEAGFDKEPAKAGTSKKLSIT